MKKESTTRIVWAIDPFHKEIGLQRSVARVIQNLARKADASVQPVYLLSSPYGVPANVPVDSATLQRKADQQLKKLLRSIRLKNLQPFKLFVETGFSQREQIEKLISYAQASNIDLIVTGSYARKGPVRWILGSFAETLVLRSNVPLLVINPRSKRETPFQNILFPTDFSDLSHEAFQTVIRWAQKLKSRVTVFHKAISPVIYSGELSWMAADLRFRALEEAVRTSLAKVQEWAEECRKAGVKTDYFVDKTPGSTPDAILRFSKKQCALIAMAAQSDALQSVLLGSVARQVVRNSSYPVWLLHPPKKATVHQLPIISITETEVLEDLGMRSETVI